MHHELDKIEKILKTIRESTEKPVTIKLRKSKHALKILKIAEKYCDAITIHSRTQQQGYSGKPDLEFAEEIKSKTKLPVIYSGNVDENNAKKLLKKFDFIMIGRASLGNPNIFAKLTGKPADKKSITLKKIDFFDYLELAEKFFLLFKQIKLQAMNFTKGKPKATEMRRKLIKAKTIRDIKRIYT